MRVHCPICKVQQEVPDGFAYRPFCSLRCKQVDLGNWLNETYRISRPLRPDELSDDELLLS